MEAEVLGHGHGFVEVAGEPVGGMGVAAERDRAAAFFGPLLGNPWPDRAADVELECSAAAGDRPHRVAELVFEPFRVKRPFPVFRPVPDRVLDVAEEHTE
jgi:hypothetical protein